MLTLQVTLPIRNRHRCLRHFRCHDGHRCRNFCRDNYRCRYRYVTVPIFVTISAAVAIAFTVSVIATMPPAGGALVETHPTCHRARPRKKTHHLVAAAYASVPSLMQGACYLCCCLLDPGREQPIVENLEPFARGGVGAEGTTVQAPSGRHRQQGSAMRRSGRCRICRRGIICAECGCRPLDAQRILMKFVLLCSKNDVSRSSTAKLGSKVVFLY